jgi:putative exosortase-associated protein (TIGR04073 family)
MRKLFLSAIFLLLTAPGWAYQQTPSDYSRTDPALGATRKLGRGLSNTGLGWVELFKGVQSVGEEKGFWAGATWGPLYGAVNAIKRTGVGVAETLTFPIGGKNNYEPILQPEFVLGDENNG